MEANNYIPRVFDGDLNFPEANKADSSKWNAIHKVVDNPHVAIVHSPSSIGSLFRVACVLGIALGLLWFMRNGRTVIAKWQQNMYRRANRRRHGIPDSDNRPFNIAYAAAALAKKERQRAEQEKSRAQIANDPRKSSTASLRFRQSMPSDSMPPISSIHNMPNLKLQELNAYYPTNRPVLPGGYPSESQEPQQSRFIQLNVDKPRPGSVRLRSKREDELTGLNRDRRAASMSKHAPRREAIQVASRGHKRQVNEEDEWEASLDKRARVESASHGAHEKDVEMTLATPDVEPSKGIKRDREELESTPDSGADESDESPQPQSRRTRQRREPPEQKEIPREAVKTHKRRHSQEESTASERDREDAHIAKHRRKIVMGHDTTESEAEDLKEYSEDPGCAGRKIGEIWDVNGQTFKVGLDGRRLRQVLIKQRRSRFSMPKDSIHLDVKADMEVFVEKWLDDQEYKDAKDNHELVWQDTPPVPTNGTHQLHQSTGKRLLWDGPPKSPIKGRKTMHASPVQNPFDLMLSNASRRASSVHMLAGPGENPQLKTSRSFSKWEKQDFEALSLQKFRARMEKEKVNQELAKPLNRKDDSLLPDDGKRPLPPVTPSIFSSGSTFPLTSEKHMESDVSPSPAPATSVVPIPVSGVAPAKPALLSAKDVEIKSMPAAPSASSKTDTTPAPSFNFNAAFQPSAASSSILGASVPPSSSTFTSGTFTPAPGPVQSGKPEISTIFTFQPSTTTGSTAAKPFGFPPATANPSTTTTAGPALTGPKTSFNFAPLAKEDSSQSKAASDTAPGLASAGFGFSSPTSSGSETQKNIFSNPQKSLNVPAATNPINPNNHPKFTFGSTSSFSQPASGPFASNKPAADANPVLPAFPSASTPPPATSAAFVKPAESQNSTSLFSRLGSQSSTTQSSSAPFGGFGIQATKPDQTAVKAPLFAFGTKEPGEPGTATISNAFGPVATPNSERSKTTQATEPQKSVFGSQTSTNNIFGASPSTGQGSFGTAAFSQPTKNAFGQVSQPVSTFGPTAAPKFSFGSSAPKQSSEPMNQFGIAPQAANASNQSLGPQLTFGQSVEPKGAFGQVNQLENSSSDSAKTPFAQNSATDTTKNAFGHISASTANAPKSIFGQGFTTPPKSVFGQPSELSQPAFGTVSASNSTMPSGNTSASAGSNTIGSSEGTSSPAASSGGGFKFTFGGGSSAPTTFAGFGNLTSGNNLNTSDQPKPADNAKSTAPNFTSAFNQPSVFNSSRTFSFGSNNASSSGSLNQLSGASDPAEATNLTSQTTIKPPSGGFNFNKPSQE